MLVTAPDILATVSVPLAQLKVPVVFTISAFGEPLTKSTDNVPAPEKLTAPVFNTPCVVVPVPGAIIPPALTVMAPPVVPVPPNVAPLATDTAPVAAPELPVKNKLPTLTDVVPV